MMHYIVGIEVLRMRLDHRDNYNKTLIYISFTIVLFWIRIPMVCVSDDAIVRASVQDQSLFDNFIHRWTYNGRIFTDVLANVFYRMPMTVWKVFDVGIYLAIAFMLARLFTQNSWKNVLSICALILLYPTEYLISAGYIATSTNYVYTVFSLLYICIYIQDLHKGRSVHPIRYPLILLAILYATNHDQTAMVLLGGMALYIAYCIYRRTDKAILLWLSVIFGISFMSYVFMYFVPGHQYRMHNTNEMNFWLPEYANWSLAKRIYKGYSSTVAVLFFTDLKIFHLFCLLIALCGFSQKSKINRAISLIPGCVILLGNLLGKDNFVIRNTSTLRMCDLISPHENPIPLLLTVMSVLSILYTFWTCIEDLDRKVYLEILMILAAGSRWMMGFSATIYASSYRTFTFFIYALIISILLILNELKSKMPNRAEWVAIGAIAMALLA